MNPDSGNLTPQDCVVVAYVCRHGTTLLNSQGRFRGDKNIPLDAKGEKDAENIKEQLKGVNFGLVMSSDLDRAKKTAQIATGLPEQAIEGTPALRPLDVGNLAGKKKSAHLKEIRDIQKDHGLRLPGSGESLNDFDKRIRTPLLKALHAGVRTGKPSLIFTHASVIHGVGELLHKDHEHNLVKPGGIVRIVYVPHPAGGEFVAQPIFKPKSGADGYAS
jgi:broad specificity phosphatase PhoE